MNYSSKPSDQAATLVSPDVEQLRQFFTVEFMIALGLSPQGWARWVVDPIVRLPTARLAHLAVTFEHQLAQSGIVEATHWLLFQFVESIDVRGARAIPERGPLLIAANHPAVYEALAIAANLSRNDLKIVISGLPFTQALPETAQYTICVEPNLPGLAVRPMVQHLQTGGALLIFPSGLVDPDPDLEPGSIQVLETWSPSLNLILRHVPETRLVVAIVSGVLTKACLHNPLTRLIKEPWHRRKAALLLQLIQQLAFARDFGLNPRVTFGEPITLADLSGDAPSFLPEIIENALGVLMAHQAQ